MVATPSILSAGILVLSPLFWVLQSVPSLLKSINKIICVFVYLPLGFLATLVFVGVSLLSLPVAWFYTIKTKFRFEKWSLMTGRKLPKSSTFRSSWFAYIFVGPLQMLMRLVQDTFIFIKNLFVKVSHDCSAQEMVYLKLEHFEMVEEVLENFGGLYCTKPVNLKLIILEF